MIDTSDFSIEKMIDTFLINHDVANNSRRVYGYAINYFFRWMVQTGRDATNPQRADIIAYKSDMAQRLMAPTVGLYISALKCFFRWANNTGLFDDITKGIKTMRKMHRYARNPLSREDVMILLGSIKSDSLIDVRDHTIITLLYYNALRMIEISRLRHKDVNLERKQIWIRGKGRDNYEDVHITSTVIYAIERYIQRKVDAGIHIDDTGFLFQSHALKSKEGRPMDPALISHIISDRMKAAGIKTSSRITGHSIRHSAAVHMINGGNFDLYAVQLFMRHSDSNTTRLYTHHAEKIKMQNNQPTAFLERYLKEGVTSQESK